MAPNADKASPAWLTKIPWLTLCASALVVGIWFWPGSFDCLVYDRQKIASGQWWRLFSGHWVHFSAGHLFWNLVILVLAGAWLEPRNRTAVLWTILTAPVAISIALLALQPSLQLYAGISGIVSGLLVGLVTWGLRSDPEKRWLWYSITGLFAAKMALELVAPHSIQSSFTPMKIQTIPIAHLIGATTGALIVLRSLGPAEDNAEQP